MTRNHQLTTALVAALAAAGASALELTTNGGFEAGDTSGWADFTLPAQTFEVTTDANTGGFAGVITNEVDGQPAVVKQANLGVGVVTPGQEVTISFAAKGVGMIGGVAFAEFFSELDGGGVSQSEILGGGPLALDPDNYQVFNFTATTGPDVGGGVTLQLNPVTGANIGSTSVLFIDDVSVSVEVEVDEVVGDYNASGLVEQGDLNQVLNNWGSSFDTIAAAWVNQRPTEGIVDQAELNVVLNNWGADAAPDFSGRAVPEPAGLCLLGLGGLGLLRRRR